MANFLIDLRQTLRSLLRDRGFTGLAVLMLAVGIASNATIFSVLDAALLRPLPLPDASRLVQVYERTPEGADFVTSEPNFLDFRAQSRSLVALGAYRELAVDLVGSGEPQRLRGAAVSASLFDALGVRPQMGRTFLPAEDAAVAPARVVVLSDAFWRGSLGGHRDVLDQSIVLNGVAHVVVGVMPQGFRTPDADVWVPLNANPAGDRGDHWLTMVGRLRPGTTLAAAERDLASVAGRIGALYPAAKGWSVRVESLQDALTGNELRTGLWTLMVAVALFLLLTCANVANLFITRVQARSEELAVRAALGAGKRRLATHLLLEALVLAGVGGLLGLLTTFWALDGIRTLAGGRFPALETVQVDLRVIGFTMLATVAAALLFSLTPALRAARQDLHVLLKSGVRGGTRRESHRARELLLVAQAALATVLLLGSGLVVRSLIALQRVDPGFSAEGLIAVPLELTSSRYNEEWRRAVFFQQLAARIEQIPGVEAAGASTTDPFRPFHFVNDVTPIERAAEVGPAGLLQTDWRVVTRGYFRAARVSLLQGRLFDQNDRFDAPRVAVITAEMARRLWPGQSALGRSFYWGGIGGNPISVIGVVGDIRDFELASAPPLMFLPTTQMTMPMMTMLVRARGDVEALTRSIRAAVWDLDPTVPVPSVRLVADNRADALARPRVQALLMTSFGALALLVAALGVYALVSFQVTSRARELGIRCALGARPHALTGLILRRTALLVAAGLIAGSVLTAPLTAAVRALLFQTAPLDPRTFVTVGLVLSAAALLAAYLPARRITRMDPLRVLRAE